VLLGSRRGEADEERGDEEAVGDATIEVPQEIHQCVLSKRETSRDVRPRSCANDSRVVETNRFRSAGVSVGVKRSVIRRDGDRPDLRAEWRRLGYATVFFAACVLVVVLLSVVGLYH